MKTLLFIFTFIAGFVMQAQAQKTPDILLDFKFYTVDGTNKAVTKANIKAGITTYAIFFDPGCDHCQHEADLISKNLALFKNAQLIWVSTEEPAKIAEFKKKYFSNAANVWVLQDKDYRFDSFFGYSEAPTIHVFDKTGKHVKTYGTKQLTEKAVLPQELATFIK